MNSKSLHALWIVALVGVFALFARSMSLDSPEPPRLPPMVPDAEPVAVRVVVELPTVTGELATAKRPTPTPTQSFVESLPKCVDAKGGELCADVVVAPAPTAPSWQVCNSAFEVAEPSAAVPCIKPTETPIATVAVMFR
jgi:hypothetical protein